MPSPKQTKTNCTENMHNNIFLHGHFIMCIINIHLFISTHTSSPSRFGDKKSLAPVSRANRPRGTQFWVLLHLYCHCQIGTIFYFHDPSSFPLPWSLSKPDSAAAFTINQLIYIYIYIYIFIATYHIKYTCTWNEAWCWEHSWSYTHSQ